ncbi:pseudouridine synthase [Lutibacter aestuarii]|uniref:Pseudouridine synthase n=1 Tax=Lutibacter aestuarii TaxID=861111 RepID=A0ABW2Z335_9FLAO|nr:pseudouridine synthase [uncultured Lutibacter sp.]
MDKFKHQHFAMYKPDGYLSQFTNNDVSKNKKKLLGEFYTFPKNIMAIGRLDEPSEGLLLLTTNGKTSEFIRSRKIEKEYLAQVDGNITSKAIEMLKKGVEISVEGKKYLTNPCEVSKLNEHPVLPKRNKKIRDDRHGPTSWISITITEGKFRQVRKMTAAVGFPTLRLVRVRIGHIKLQNMIPGEVKKINL